MKRGIVLGGFILCFFILGTLTGCDDPEIPAVPGGVTAAVDGDGIRVSWNPVSGAESYVIYRLSSEDGEVNIGTAPGQQTSSFLDTTGTSTPSAVPGTSYTYAVAARNSVGTSEKSSWTTPSRVFPGVNPQIPAVPTGVTAVAQSSSTITIHWNPSEGAVGYKVYRDTTSAGTFENVSGSTPWTGISFPDEGLQANTDYFYRVSAVNSSGDESEKSAPIQIKTGPPPPPPGLPSVDWTSYTTDYVFRVRNNTNERLVAFIRNITPGNMLGGVDALANMHGFKKDTVVLGTQSSDFPVIFITEEQYNANINNLSVLEQTPFTRIYGYYNAVGNNETVYEINAGLGGRFTLEITPSLTRNVELRLSQPHGPTLGYVTAQGHDTFFKMNEGFYRVYPIVRLYNQFRNEIISFTPTWKGGPMDGSAKSVSVGLDSGTPVFRINIHELLLDTNFSTGSAFIIVENQGSSGVQVFNGGVVELTSTGGNFVNAGQTRMYQVNMAELSDGKFALKASVNSYRIGSNQINAGAIGNIELDLDQIYRVIVTGNDGGFSVSAPVWEGIMEL